MEAEDFVVSSFRFILIFIVWTIIHILLSFAVLKELNLVPLKHVQGKGKGAVL